MVEFFEFEWGEFGLCWSASSEDVDVGGLVGFEGLVDVVGDFGGVEFVGGFGEDAGDVEGDVADPMMAMWVAVRFQVRWNRGLPS